MSRTLTGAAQTETDKLSDVKPFNVLKIVRTAGDLYLSDAARVLSGAITTDACVLGWGNVDQRGSRIGSQQEAAAFPLADYTLRVSLADSTLRGIFLGTSPPVGCQCILYQFWNGLTWGTDEVTLFDGTLGSIAGGKSQNFHDRDVSLSLRIIDRFKTLLDKDVGNIADKTTFSDVLKADEGKALPLVYGRVPRVKAVMVKGPRSAKLMKDIDKDDTTIYGEGLSEFPSGAITIRIGDEYIEGSRSGNTFTVTARGGSASTFTSNGHKDSDYRMITSSDATGVDDQYVGLWLGVTIGTSWRPGDLAYRMRDQNPMQVISGGAPPSTNAWDGRQWRQIRGYDATAKAFLVDFPYNREGIRETAPSGGIRAWGHQTYVPSGSSLKIGTLPTAHTVGETIYQVLTDYKVIVNNAPSADVQAVYFHGKKGEWKTIEDYGEGFVDLGGGLAGRIPGSVATLSAMSIGLGAAALGGALDNAAVYQSDIADYQVIPTSFYVVDKDDNAWATELGHNVTSVTFQVLPVWIPFWAVDGFALWADVDGITDDNTPTGTVLTNPADVIEDVLVNRIGVDSGDLDATSFTATEGSLAAWLEFRGVIDRVQRGGALVAWLAFQCRSRIRFEAAKIYLDYLTNAMGANVSPTVAEGNVLLDGIDISWDSPGEVMNEIRFTYRGRQGEPEEGLVTDAASVTDYGRKSRKANLMLVSDAAQAQQVAYYWLYRGSRPWQRVTARGLLPLLPFERDDAVTVDFSRWSLDSVPADVIDIRHTPGSGGGQPDNISITMRRPVYYGCASSCEAFCETGSESIDVTVCADACETGNQTLCGLLCQTRAQNLEGCGAACQIGDQVIDMDPPDDWMDSTPCDSACQGCQGSCVSSCETWDNDCDTSCIVAGCETACQVGGCESQCEEGGSMVGPCGGVCQVASEEPGCGTCTTACQTQCETGSQACGGSCEDSCVSSCQSGCETACESASTTCADTSCNGQCEVGGCETTCETGETTTPSCDLMCETNAMAECSLSDTAFTGF